jgi:hypothetical protein
MSYMRFEEMGNMRFEATGKSKWAIRDSEGRKKGRVHRVRGSFVATLTRHCEIPQLNAICSFVVSRNERVAA